MAAIPTLLLSPDESRDRNGPVTPTVGEGVEIVAGQYGQAWGLNANGERVTVPASGVLNPNEGTVIIRSYIPASSVICYPFSAGYTSGVTLGAQSSFSIVAWVGGVRLPSIDATERDVWMTIGVRYADGVGRVYLNGVAGEEGSVGVPSFGSWAGLWAQAADRLHTTESALLYPKALSDAEIHRISTMPEAWTWAALMPKIGGVRTVHDPAPFAVRSIHEEV